VNRRILASDPESPKIIGASWGYSRERVRQIQADIIRRLRDRRSLLEEAEYA
jgi:DNA-directed RNA polymerase sigma subunit (sigma70/sigma32)